jgi:hypothetical protein
VLVRDAVADARAVEPARPVLAETPDSLVAAVDEARIRQVLANLLGNVREHTPVAAPTAVRLGQVRGGVVLEVADGGPGMAVDDAARAFDRFYRGAEQPGGAAADPAAGFGMPHGPGSARSASANSVNGSRETAESGGSGLGLAIVAAIAQAHGGQATLESAPGNGTRVRVWLPATAPAPPRAAPAPVPRLSHASHHPRTPAPARPRPGTPPASQDGPRPGTPPASQDGPPPCQPLSSPAGYLVRPAQPLPPAVGYPAPPRPLAGPVSDPPMLSAPPGPAAEIHHDWGDPPQPVPPPAGPLSRPDDPARDRGHPPRPAAASGQPPPEPGRHRRAERGPRPPAAG